MKKLILAAIVLLTAMVACQDGAKFHINGHIAGAKDSVLYLEHITLNNGVELVDSAKLGEDGAFDLAYADTASCPEFYRLRIYDQVINLGVDSTETIGIEAKWPDMAFGYTVEGSGECDTIRLISLDLRRLQNQLNDVGDDRSLTLDERQAKGEAMITAYKDSINIKYIQNRYEKASSYYALFQMVEGYMIFDLRENESDVRWATAVANAWMNTYPGTMRAKNLENIVLEGMRNTRKHTINLDLDDKKVKQTGIIDMGFPDLSGRERRLSDLKGKVVLLEFTAYAAKGVADRNIALRELYSRYHDRGLEIYQVSIDPNVHYWKTVASNLPWICVYNEEGERSDMLQIYQVQQIPSYYLIDRNNDLSARMEAIPNLEAAIQALL